MTRSFMTPLIGGFTLAAVLASAAVAQQTATPTAVAPAPSSLLPKTQALYQSYVADRKVAGIVGAFGHGDLPTAFVSAGKISDSPGAPNADPDSLWRVYSMTKPITGIAAMILIQEGKLKLDQPVGDILPAFKNMRVQLSANTIESRPATHPITIRNLLTHTAGLGYSIVTTGPLLKLYEDKGILPLAVNASLEERLRQLRPATLQEFANRVASVPLIAEPGTKWSYSIGLDVLGAVIEKASGVPFDTFVQRRIFDPLKMSSSYWTVPADAASRLASTDIFIGNERVPLDPGATSVWLKPPSFPYGGAGLVMSARDYDRFLHMLQNSGTLDGVQVLKPEIAKLAMSNLLPAGVTFGQVSAATGGTSGPAMGFGAGGAVTLQDSGGVGAGTYAWGGAAGTKAWVNPVRKLRGTIMVNFFPSDKWPIQEETGKALLADISATR